MPQEISIESIAKGLMSIPSVSKDRDACKEVIDYAARFLQDLPDVEIHEYEKERHPSMVAVYRGKKSPTVMLNGHLDVVPAPEKCFKPQVKNGKLLGRGAFDMKGECAILLSVFRKHAESNADLSLGLMLTTDEEIGGHHGVKYLVEEEGYRAKCVVVPDGGPEFKLTVAQKGVMWAKVLRKGKSAHASMPEKGINPILTFMESHSKLVEGLKKVPEATVSLNNMKTGDNALNVVPAVCEATMDVRAFNADDARKVLKSVFSKQELSFVMDEPPSKVDPDNEYVRLFKAAMKKIRGKEPEHHRESGMCDARFFMPLNIPVIISSPIGGGYHQDDEWSDLESLEIFERILLEFLSEAEK